MPKLSVVVAHVPGITLDIRLSNCLESLKGQYEELILVVNEGIGFGKAFNYGFKYATGDYIAAVSNDTVLLEGNLSDLCVPDTVTSPMVNSVLRDEFWACFFVWPRNVYEKVGGFDETFGLAYYEDLALEEEFKKHNIPMKGVLTVRIGHEGGATVKTISDEDTNMAIGRKRFIEKYGSLP